MQQQLVQEFGRKVSTVKIEPNNEMKLPAGEYYIYKGKLIPKQFGWFLALLFLMEKGFKIVSHYKFGFREEVREGLEMFDYDPEMKGFAPIVPYKVEIYYTVKIKKPKPMSKYTGKYNIVKKEIKVVELVDSDKLADPNPFETLQLVELYLETKLRRILS